MELRFTVRNRIKLSAPRDFAFGYIQDPRSMMTDPRCVEASGTAGPGGSGRLRFKHDDGRETVNNWMMEKWDPPSEGVAHQWIQTSNRNGLGPVVDVVETNTFTSSGSETFLARVSTFTIPTPKRVGWAQRRALVRSFRQGDRIGLERLAADLARLRQTPRAEATSIGNHPDHGPYFAADD